MTTTPLLSFDRIDFAYGGRPVLHGLTLDVPHGATVLLGPNGAGKTTLLSIAALVLEPRSGTLRLGELSPADRASRRRWKRAVAILPQSITPMRGLTCREQVAYVGWLKGMSRADAWAQSPDALAAVGLADRADDAVTGLSGGQRRRVGIAQTLVHGPRVVLLDEPTAGLDPVEVQRLRSLLDDLRGHISIIESTHQAGELDAHFDHVVVLDGGAVRFAGSPDHFLADPTGRRTTVVDAYARAIGVHA